MTSAIYSAMFVHCLGCGLDQISGHSNKQQLGKDKSSSRAGYITWPGLPGCNTVAHPKTWLARGCLHSAQGWVNFNWVIWLGWEIEFYTYQFGPNGIGATMCNVQCPFFNFLSKVSILICSLSEFFGTFLKNGTTLFCIVVHCIDWFQLTSLGSLVIAEKASHRTAMIVPCVDATNNMGA